MNFQDEMTRAVCLLPPELQGPATAAGRRMAENNRLVHTTEPMILECTRQIADSLLDPARALIARIQRESKPDRRF
jgi:hypothetical protein